MSLVGLVRGFNSFTKASESSALARLTQLRPASSRQIPTAASDEGASESESESDLPFVVCGEVVGIAPAMAIPAFRQHPSEFTVARSHVALSSALSSSEARTAAVAAVLAEWRAAARFACLAGWRNERFAVHSNKNSSVAVATTAATETLATAPLLAIERSAIGLFGCRTFGCHLNGFVRCPQSGSIRMWIARRSFSKPTNPGMLDNIVGGGLPSGAHPTPNIIKEALEEAGIPPAIAASAKAVSVVSLWFASPVRGLIPDTEFCYDLQLDPSFVPQPADGEVHEFFLWDMDTVKSHLLAGEFTSEAALCIVDFMVRHGILTPENDPGYLEIVFSLRREFPFGGPSFISSQ